MSSEPVRRARATFGEQLHRPGGSRSLQGGGGGGVQAQGAGHCSGLVPVGYAESTVGLRHRAALRLIGAQQRLASLSTHHCGQAPSTSAGDHSTQHAELHNDENQAAEPSLCSNLGVMALGGGAHATCILRRNRSAQSAPCQSRQVLFILAE